MTKSAANLSSSFNGAQNLPEIEELVSHLGSAVRRRRRILGLTQHQLGEAIGVRFQQIQKYECGANKMSAATLGRIAIVLQTTAGSFYPASTDEMNNLEGDMTPPALLMRLAASWHSLDAGSKSVLDSAIKGALRGAKPSALDM